MGLASNIYVLIVGRLVAGLGVGVTAMALPMYLAEVCPSIYRGRMITAYTFCITFGQLVSVVVCLWLDGRWRWMFAASIFLAVIQLFGTLYCPESPRWLYGRGDVDKAKSVILRIYASDSKGSKDSVARELESLRMENEKTTNSSYFSLVKELCTSNRPALIAGVGLQALQQLAGINTAMYYGPSILQKAGYNGSGSEALKASIPLFCVGVTGMFCAVLMIDRLGRRTLLLWTVPFMTVCLAGEAMGFYLLNYSPANSQLAGYLCIAFIAAYVGFFALGLGPIPWAINAEIFPTHLRSIANSFATATNWLFNVIVCMSFLSLTSSNLGQVLAWATYCFFGVVTWVFVYALLPETKGRSLDSILKQFRRS